MKKSCLELPGWQDTSGSNNASAKLDEAKVRRILKSDKTNVALAEKYGVSPQAISDIRNGRRWREVYIEHHRKLRGESCSC